MNKWPEQVADWLAKTSAGQQLLLENRFWEGIVKSDPPWRTLRTAFRVNAQGGRQAQRLTRRKRIYDRIVGQLLGDGIPRAPARIHLDSYGRPEHNDAMSLRVAELLQAFSPIQTINDRTLLITPGVNASLVAQWQLWTPRALFLVPETAEEFRQEVIQNTLSPAGRRAEALLLDHLNDEQRHDYLHKRYFDVIRVGSLPGGVKALLELPPSKRDRFGRAAPKYVIPVRRYRITSGVVADPFGNVLMVSASGKLLIQMCAHPLEPFPMPDIMLAQKLWLERDELDFLQTANFWAR